jgi:hypothetical protein
MRWYGRVNVKLYAKLDDICEVNSFLAVFHLKSCILFVGETKMSPKKRCVEKNAYICSVWGEKSSGARMRFLLYPI